MAKVKRLVVKGALRVVNVEDIHYDTSYQRGVVSKHKQIVSAFNPDALGVPLIGERDDGSLWCVDGRQRLTAISKLGHKTIRAEVFASRGPEHEAEVFRLVNKGRTPLRPLEIFNASLTAGDQKAWDIKGIVESLGFKIPASATSGRGRRAEKSAMTLGCVNTLFRVYNSCPERLPEVLGVVKQIWPDDPLRTTADIIEGISSFFARYQSGIDTPRLIDRLGQTTPGKLLYSASLGVGGRAANIADAIGKIYRSTGKKKKA